MTKEVPRARVLFHREGYDRRGGVQRWRGVAWRGVAWRGAEWRRCREWRGVVASRPELTVRKLSRALLCSDLGLWTGEEPAGGGAAGWHPPGPAVRHATAWEAEGSPRPAGGRAAMRHRLGWAAAYYRHRQLTGDLLMTAERGEDESNIGTLHRITSKAKRASPAAYNRCFKTTSSR